MLAPLPKTWIRRPVHLLGTPLHCMANSLPVVPGLRLDLVSLAMSRDSTFSVSRLAGTLSALLDFFASTWSASGTSRGGCGFPHPPRVGLNLRSSWRGCSGARILLRLGLCLLSAPTWWRRTLRRDRSLGHLGQPRVDEYHGMRNTAGSPVRKYEEEIYKWVWHPIERAVCPLCPPILTLQRSVEF